MHEARVVDVEALYDALEVKRIESGFSWRETARQTAASYRRALEVE